MSTGMIEVYKSHRTVQDKYVYFLLLAAAAGIALAVCMTTDSKLSQWQGPLALAVLAWAVSFYCGCRALRHIEAKLAANVLMLQHQSLERPSATEQLKEYTEVRDKIRRTVESYGKPINRQTKLQFRFLVFGAIMFVAWHITNMVLRTEFSPPAPTTPETVETQDDEAAKIETNASPQD